MDPIVLARCLGWFSLALGAVEIAVPNALIRMLGVRGGPALMRGFGAREMAAGVIVLAAPESAIGPATRLAGDALDIAVLGAALSPRNSRRVAASVALALVVGVTILDAVCTKALADK